MRRRQQRARYVPDGPVKHGLFRVTRGTAKASDDLESD